MTTPRKPGERAGLTMTAILQAATDLLATGGLDALSMRSVARELGVAPNALYSHVTSKDALIDALLDHALAEIAIPATTPVDPVAALAEMMTATYDVLVRRAELMPAYLRRQGSRGPVAVALGQAMDIWLADAGVPAAEIPGARRVLIVHAIGFAAFSTSGPDAERPIPTEAARRQFLDGLTWLLDGITADNRAPS